MTDVPGLRHGQLLSLKNDLLTDRSISLPIFRLEARHIEALILKVWVTVLRTVPT